MKEIDFAQFSEKGTLESFIEDLEKLSASQQKVVDKYQDRKSLASIIAGLEIKISDWNKLIASARAFRSGL